MALRFCAQAASSEPDATGFSLPLEIVVMRLDDTPLATSMSRAALARRWPRPRLYSSVPRSSELPSTRMLTWGYLPSHPDCASRVERAESSRVELSNA